MYTYRISPAMVEDKLFEFLRSIETPGQEAVNAYPDVNDQWQVLTSENPATALHHYTYRLLPAAEEGRLSEVLMQLQQEGWTLFSLQPVPKAPGLWRVIGRQDAGSSPGPKDGGPASS